MRIKGLERLILLTLQPIYLDGFVKSPKTPSPLMGEGRGEGEYSAISTSYVPSPLSPPIKGGEIRLFTGAST